MQGATSKSRFRSNVSQSRHDGRIRHADGAEGPLTSGPGFAAEGLFASCLALLIEHEITQLAVLELMLICAAPPLAALAGVRVARQR